MEKNIFEVARQGVGQTKVRKNASGQYVDASRLDKSGNAIVVSLSKSEDALIAFAEGFWKRQGFLLLKRDAQFCEEFRAAFACELVKLVRAHQPQAARVLQKTLEEMNGIFTGMDGVEKKVKKIRNVVVEKIRTEKTEKELQKKAEAISNAEAYVAKYGLQAAIRDGILKI